MQGARASIMASQYRMQKQHATNNHHWQNMGQKHTLVVVLVIVFTTARLAVVHSPHAQGKPPRGNNTGGPIGTAGTPALFPQLHGPFSAVEY